MEYSSSRAIILFVDILYIPEDKSRLKQMQEVDKRPINQMASTKTRGVCTVLWLITSRLLGMSWVGYLNQRASVGENRRLQMYTVKGVTVRQSRLLTLFIHL